jgi:hypothetical protein
MLFTVCMFLHSVYYPTDALHTTTYTTLIPTCFGTKLPPSGTYSILVLYINTLIINYLHCQFLVAFIYSGGEYNDQF